MAAYRVTCKPDRHISAGVEYDVEEELEMRQNFRGELWGELCLYWSYLEGPFDTLEEANSYVERLLCIGSDRVVKEYR
jgi:hypothetical protein